MEMKLVTIALGSNQGNRGQNILQALTCISERIGTIIHRSPFYENEAQGFESKELFLNGCIAIETILEPLNILQNLKEIETDLGRNKKSDPGYSSRPIDLDIILIDNQVINLEDLAVPHPRFRERLFVLKPLCDIQPTAVDPLTLQSVQELLNRCPDKSVLTIHELKEVR
ncbi:MAG: 2-amino-4-hydroxy-6-hydroxymethyldihydropteridine diphosphokinase [Flavobacteriia bacterium]|jgi:deoxyguanosine kinase|nr:2-amino-4-hydroxy-6-hydroxymethyldihydropteridine diphosphokinase [Cryomorphaceae bacterium]